ncbi:uncharacterized protein [Parasteatoda tepidariorum]|uniref:uncharacterized protein n=1 Tax=Parasteatoda tepidariorum TaxID=114398 RepID=UPI001C7190DF|nr:uncharacterized protein LOC107445301 [Parasteatoda tepidariorum]
MKSYSLLFLFALMCVHYASCEIKEECEGTMDQLRMEVHDMMDEGAAPECIKKCGLDAFRENDEDRKQKMKELREHMENLDEGQMKEALNCMGEIKEAVMKRMEGADVDKDCMKHISKESQDIWEYIVRESE